MSEIKLPELPDGVSLPPKTEKEWIVTRAIGHLLPDGKGRTIIYINEFEGLDVAATTEYDALILDYSDKSACEDFVRRLRGASCELLYLKPVFLLSGINPESEVIRQLIDGIIPAVQLGNICQPMEQIMQRNREIIKAAHASSENKGLLMKVVRFLASRNSEITPVTDPNTAIGYSFPILSVSCPPHQVQEIMEVINQGVAKKYFEASFIARLHLCPDCFTDSFNLREGCADCGSLLIGSENPGFQMHCTAAGTESNVARKSGSLGQHCVESFLKVGVDYYKPVRPTGCQVCHSTAQDPEIKAFCNSCHTESHLENLLDFDVAALALTPAGRAAALQPSGNSEAASVVSPGIVSIDSFTVFLEHQLERAKDGAAPGCAGMLQLKLRPADKNRLGNRVVRLLKEVAEEVKAELPESNFLSLSYTHHALLFLFPDSSFENAKETIALCRQLVERILRFNIAITGKKVRAVVKEIPPEMRSEEELLLSLLS